MLQQDRWRSLPDDIIAKIISHLDLVHRPGYLYTITISATTFIVHFFDHCRPLDVTFNISEFWKILDNLFTLFTTPSIDTFNIYLHPALYDEPCARPILNSWARRLRARNIQRFAIEDAIKDRLCPPTPSVFQIQSLVSLYLSYTKFVSQHPTIILPNLKRLRLVSVNHGFLGRLLSSCPSLEDLSFSLNDKPTGKNSSVSISSKTLKRLSITLDISRVSGDVEVIIDAQTLDDLYFNVNSPLQSMRMLGLISNLKSIGLAGSVSMTMIYRSPSKTIFPFVTELTLSVSSSEVFEQHMLPYYFPNLERLVLYFCFSYNNDWDIKGRFVLVEYVKHLQLRMDYFRLNQRTLNFLTWLLTSAPNLEKLFIDGFGSTSTLFNDDFLDKDQFYENLLNCAEDTSCCEIEFCYERY
ncbi:putative F-box/FBD/LRR-repeat protein At5g22670 [Silene latifolia]|uniref:putative F-box/FBD/LRR-repeat protein At5g22670 n=1 Tax=Silene latifolia TaxID=37657 RepID=UPI003D7783DB